MPLSGLPHDATLAHLSNSTARPRLTVAFLLPSDMFELVYGDECLAAVRALAALSSYPSSDPARSSESWTGDLSSVDAVFTGWNTPLLDEALLQRLPRLRAVFHAAGSVRPYVTDAFWTRGISISTAAAANAIPVAEYTLGAILLSLKQAWRLNRQARNERAFPQEFPSVQGVRGATIGLVSLGLIGREVLKRLRSFEVQVIAHDPHLPSTRFRELGVESVSLPELMARSDIVSLHTPLNPKTRGFITGALLSRLKPGATFINTARGGLIQEPELIAFLRGRPDVQAILDVSSPEPPTPESPLYDLPNVFLTPHISGSLGPECRRLGLAMVEEFRRYVRGEQLLSTVSQQQAIEQT